MGIEEDFDECGQFLRNDKSFLGQKDSEKSFLR